MTITKRIVLLSSFLCAAILGVSVFSVARVTALRDVTLSITTDSLPGVILSDRLAALQSDNQIALMRLLIVDSPEERRALAAEMQRKSEEISDTAKKYEATIFDPIDRANFQAVSVQRAAYKAKRDAFVAELNENRANAVRDLPSVLDAYDAYKKATSALSRRNSDVATDDGTNLAHDVAFARYTLAIVAFVSLAIGIALSLAIARNISSTLRRVAGTLGDGSAQVAAAANQVSQYSQTLAQGASEQAASLEETSASLEEIASMTKRNAENADNANSLASQTRKAAEDGSRDMVAMSQAMAEIKASSDDVAKIIKEIEEIAFQTNILALNAAVEAARAGEAGMGFAVVADEVRALAQRSSRAARDTAERIEGAISKTAQGVSISGKVALALEDIVGKVRRVAELNGEVSSASGEQTAGIGQLNQAVSEMDKVTQSNAAGAEESASAAEELNGQAVMLQEAVGELVALVDPAKSRALSLARHSAGQRVPKRHASRTEHRAPGAVKGPVLASV